MTDYSEMSSAELVSNFQEVHGELFNLEASFEIGNAQNTSKKIKEEFDKTKQVLENEIIIEEAKEEAIQSCDINELEKVARSSKLTKRFVNVFEGYLLENNDKIIKEEAIHLFSLSRLKIIIKESKTTRQFFEEIEEKIEEKKEISNKFEFHEIVDEIVRRKQNGNLTEGDRVVPKDV